MVIKTYKKLKTKKKNDKLIATVFLSEGTVKKVVIAESTNDGTMPYLAVNKQAMSKKALCKKRKQICHELNNVTGMVLKELAGSDSTSKWYNIKRPI